MVRPAVTQKPRPRYNQRDVLLLPHILALKAEHPFWGYRRVWANLKFRLGFSINKKCVARILREQNLGVKRSELKVKRAPNHSKPRPCAPNQWWGIDMTKVMTDAGWIYIVIVLDWYSKKIVGFNAGYQSKTTDWLKALDMGANSQFPDGVRWHNLNLMSDNGCQPTSVNFMCQCGFMGIKQAFTSYNNPKGNADTERMFRTMKEELLWINEWQGLNQLNEKLKIWIKSYNHEYLHSALKWKTPVQMENYYYNNKNGSPLIAA